MATEQRNIGIGESNTFSDASQHTLAEHPVDADCSGVAQAIVCARRVSDGAAKQFMLRCGFRRTGGNVAVHSVAQVAVLGSTPDLNALSAVEAVFDVIGTGLIIRVEGIANTAIDWGCSFTGYSVNHIPD